ncbi:MAG: hydrogen gas-evolving membrane-bound hydrogenase subunit E [Verrucomicrobiota bacterium]
MKIFGLLAVFVTGALLISAVVDFPDFGDPESPANAGEVATHFVEKTYEETHVPNMVTAVLADYRGYDTMFETVVIFTGGVAIIAILQGLGLRRKKGMVPTPPRAEGDHHDIIIGTTCRILIPVIQLFALYVVAHGHYSPGGGFQGGVILGASFILWAIARDLDAGLARMPERRFLVLGVVGILIYGVFGWVAQFLGANFLDYSVLHEVMPATDPIMARYHSMLGVEVGVAFTVTAIMFAIYAHLSTRGELEGGL